MENRVNDVRYFDKFCRLLCLTSEQHYTDGEKLDAQQAAEAAQKAFEDAVLRLSMDGVSLFLTVNRPSLQRCIMANAVFFHRAQRTSTPTGWRTFRLRSFPVPQGMCIRETSRIHISVLIILIIAI